MLHNEPLAAALDSKAKQHLLRILLNPSYTPIAARDLARRAGIAHTSANRILEQFRELGLVSPQEAGPANLWAVDKKSIVFQELQRVMQPPPNPKRTQGWFKLLSRNMLVQKALVIDSGISAPFQDRYGVRLTRFLWHHDGRKADYYIDQGEYETVSARIDALLDDERFIENFASQTRAELDGFLSEIEGLLTSHLPELSNRALLKLYDSLIGLQARFQVPVWTVFILEPILTRRVQGTLESRFPPEKARELLLTYSTPLEMNNVLEERVDALKLAIERKRLSNGEFHRRIQAHARKYDYMPMFDFITPPMPPERFEAEILKVGDPAHELGELTRMFNDRPKLLERALGELESDGPTRHLARLLNHVAFLKDYRDMVRAKISRHLRPFYDEVGRRAGLTVNEVALLSNEEIRRFLDKKELPPLAEIKGRARTFLIAHTKDQVTVLSGPQADQAFARQVPPLEESNRGELRGTPASPGIAEGPVRIVANNMQLHRVKPGDIMVTAMTKPDFVPAMRRCAAIVTDEGGVTCHAAIVSRELSLPCVVGTRNATQLLKDGDIVRVDADKGVVTKTG